MVVEDGTIERDSFDAGDVFEFAGVCRVYVCCSDSGTNITLEKGGWSSFHENRLGSLAAGFIGKFVYFD
jgi:hypothetical protein